MEIGTSEAEPIWTEFLCKLTRRAFAASSRHVRRVGRADVRLPARPVKDYRLVIVACRFGNQIGELVVVQPTIRQSCTYRPDGIAG
jgi:hypothetical protein